jgi:hypothetical protein
VDPGLRVSGRATLRAVRPPPAPRGAAALFVLATIALLVALVVAAIGAERPLSPRQGALLAAAAAVALLALRAEFRRDDHDAAMFVVVPAFLWTLVLGAIALFGRQRHPVAAAVALACAAAFVAALVHVIRVRTAVDPVPDVLWDTFGSRVVETDAVHWIALGPGEPATAARLTAVEVWLQNTHDAPRDVRVHVELERGLVGPALSTVRLAPLEVGALTIPLSAAPDATGAHEARIWVDASGGGRRVRRARRTYARRRLSPVVRILGMLTSLHNPLEAIELVRATHGVKLAIETVPAAGAVAARAVEGRWRSTWRAEGTSWAARRAGLVR